MKDIEIKVEGVKKILADYEMGYDIIEDTKKTKANIYLFKMCSLPQQKKKLLEALDPPISKPKEVIQSEE